MGGKLYATIISPYPKTCNLDLYSPLHFEAAQSAKKSTFSRTRNDAAIFSPQYYGCIGLFILIFVILAPKMELGKCHRVDPEYNFSPPNPQPCNVFPSWKCEPSTSM